MCRVCRPCGKQLYRRYARSRARGVYQNTTPLGQRTKTDFVEQQNDLLACSALSIIQRVLCTREFCGLRMCNTGIVRKKTAHPSKRGERISPVVVTHWLLCTKCNVKRVKHTSPTGWGVCLVKRTGIDDAYRQNSKQAAKQALCRVHKGGCSMPRHERTKHAAAFPLPAPCV